ncbi:HAMP domain-containing sensor histidine kinase [Undibacterium sp.]|uniref:sensor histidine kinase n=1 Tax=Undibacterium sp. TaxID=1914977 RepID=UPI0027303889|nr:hypothetical protein [Undibacterium sp.]MDP1977057.1 hypothetical protein [Undibacterium sp.]
MTDSIQRRLFMILGSFTALICIAYTLIALLLAYVTEDMVLESMLAQQAKVMIRSSTSHETLPRPDMDFMQLYTSVDAMPAAVSQEVRESHVTGGKKLEIFGKDGKHYHVLRLQLGSEQEVYLLAEVSPFLVVSHLSTRVAGMMSAVALLMLVAALLLAYFLVRRIALPLQQLAEEVSATPAKEIPNFKASLRRDEIGFLAKKLEDSLHARHTALLRETNFTRDLSHELRTPITILNNLLLAGQGRILAEEDALVARQSVDDLMHTLDILLALARAENMLPIKLDLIACIEQSLLFVHYSTPAKRHEVTLDLPAQWLVLGNPHLIGLLLNNLFNNAMTHGDGQAAIHVFFEHPKLILSNAIRSDRHSHTAGFGHGRNLMERITSALGWEIRFEHSVDKFQVEIIPRQAIPGS